MTTKIKTEAFLKVGLRQNAIYIPKEFIGEKKPLTETTILFLANVNKLGFTFSETLLLEINATNPLFRLQVLDVLREVLGTDKNWTPLVKNWKIPTGETILDHIVTFYSNVFQAKKGTKLVCGHFIPQNTFPLERYNGCPFCGTPFEFGKIENQGQNSKLKVLELWSDKNVTDYLESILTSKTALDASQIDSLKLLIQHLPLPEVTIGMKETLMVVIDLLVVNKEFEKAQIYFNTPTDILRFLWYKKTGFLQIIEPKTIKKRTIKNKSNSVYSLSNTVNAGILQKLDLNLKYSRSQCFMVAKWLNDLDLDTEKSCEIMHPKRGMWVRFIRALRLAEYNKKEGFEKLAELLDVFYNENYTVWQGQVNEFRLKSNAENTFKLLKQRPGLFARSLFANMLWFGSEETIAQFNQIIDKVPARLVFTLNMYAKNYFDANFNRSVKPLGGTNKRISANKFLKLFDDNHLKSMVDQIEAMTINNMKCRFAAIENKNKTIYIAPQLFNMPLSIGDRSDSIQDLPVALMGTKFPLEGNEIRLFMQWGQDLPAQHLDMDLSCQIAYENKLEICSYSNLTTIGCQHSGDIRSIPNKVGTAEYINIDLEKLIDANAKYVTFTCNAYSNGNITPNLIVGWMDSKNSMKISEKTGVAYDPSCVQHQVRVTQNVAKGLVFGVLDIANQEIIWLEMTFGGQVVSELDTKCVEALLAKLKSKFNIGNLLLLKAQAQGLTVVETKEADEFYNFQWAINAAQVSKLLVD